MCEFEMDFKKSFCPRSNRSNHTGNDDIISQRPDLKTGVKNGIFWSEIGSGFGKPGGTHTPRIPSTILKKSPPCLSPKTLHRQTLSSVSLETTVIPWTQLFKCWIALTIA